MTVASTKRGRPGLWAGLLFASIGAICGLKLSGAIDSTTGFILFVAAMGLAIPLVRSLGRQRECTPTQAARRYTAGIMASASAYVVGLGVAITLDKKFDLDWGAGFLVALLPALPILWMIYVMGRYLFEETDEYLRHRAIMASMVGLGILLAVASFWGFLETFGLVPHVEGWWAVPVWSLGMGLGQCVLALRDRGGADE